MIWDLIIGALCILLGAGLMYLILQSKIQVTQYLDQETALRNQQLKDEENSLKISIAQLAAQKLELNNSIESLQNSVDGLKQYADEYYNKNLELATEKLNASLEKVAAKYQEDELAYQEEYLRTIKESAEEFANDFSAKELEYQELKEKLEVLKGTVHAAVEAYKRDLEAENKLNFYRLQVPEQDVLEIKKLREVIPYLRDKEALNKVIWKVYYEKPYTSLIGRVIGSKIVTGIYKLTNIQNGMCYVGQAVDIADRWKTHIKRGVGAEAGGRNKLYPIMYQIGPENFTFEVIEQCPREKLNEREDYWQDYFKAKEFGYSIK